jgi:hypothetical protein
MNRLSRQQALRLHPMLGIGLAAGQMDDRQLLDWIIDHV